MCPSAVLRGLPTILLLTLFPAIPALAQERAYFVTYDHYLEEPRHLEVAIATTTGVPKGAHSAYTAPWLELEYGVTGWWTAELYLEGVVTRHDGSGFTGWRWENRLRPLRDEHWINPVLYVEYEGINEATRIQKEIVGTGGLAFEPIAELRQVQAHELETKLILSSAFRGWNVSENLIVEKNMSADEGLEFGYSVGTSRSLGGLARGTTCHICRENFMAGLEAYGGLGTTRSAGLSNTRHYVAPVLGWHVADRTTVKVSIGLGVTGASDRYLVRLGYVREFPVAGRR
jgi:hypothetical protein